MHTENSDPSTTVSTPAHIPPLLSWSAPQVPTFKRTTLWYVIAGACVVAAAVYGIWTRSWPLTLVVVLLTYMEIRLRNHRPSDKIIAITEQGVHLGTTFLRWEEVRGFWLLPLPDYTELHIERMNPRRGPLVIQTGPMDRAVIQEVLSRFTQEIAGKERFIDMFIRICKL